ncbi:MAG: isoprenylcysteine carboxylmethyltransferase family protein [Candidatus Acidiferrales bacterium]
MTRPRKFWMRWRVRAGYPVAAIYLLLARPSPRSILWGPMIVVVGLIVRGAASGHLRKDRELAIGGPYARTRNPLYLGSALLAAGFVVAGRSAWAGALVTLYFVVFYYAVMRNEERDLHDRFGDEFREYAKRVPLFFPRITGGRTAEPFLAGEAPASAKKFSWAQYRRNREYRAFIGTIGGLGIVWLRMELRKRLGY